MQIDHVEWRAFFDELKHETERGSAILLISWLDSILHRKFEGLFSHGNADERRKLFDDHGPFHSFAAKVAAARCLGWLDEDTAHDVAIARRIRNEFAHAKHGLKMGSPKIRKLVESFRLPLREYSDWADFSIQPLPDGTGFRMTFHKQPPEATDLDVTGVRFRLAASLLVASIAENLQIAIVLDPLTASDVGP